MRKAKRAPVTETAVAKIASQADIAGWTLNDALAECVARGWQGFKAEWVDKRESSTGEPPNFLDYRLEQKRQREEWARQRKAVGGGVE